jgi:hypothetical protein
MLTDHHIVTMLLAAPDLAICAIWLVAEVNAIRAELARLRSSRVVARREGER